MQLQGMARSEKYIPPQTLLCSWRRLSPQLQFAVTSRKDLHAAWAVKKADPDGFLRTLPRV